MRVTRGVPSGALAAPVQLANYSGQVFDTPSFQGLILFFFLHAENMGGLLFACEIDPSDFTPDNQWDKKRFGDPAPQ